MAVIDIPTNMVIDLLMFFVAMLTLAVIFIPQPEVSQKALAARGSIWVETRFGLSYVLAQDPA